MKKVPVCAPAGALSFDSVIVSERRARWRARWRRLVQSVGLAFVGFTVMGIALPCLYVPAGRCRSMQAEAKANLKVIYIAETLYHLSTPAYGELALQYSDDLEAIGFEPRGTNQRYRYSVFATESGFAALAVGVDDLVAGDIWRIDEGNRLENVHNACTR